MQLTKCRNDDASRNEITDITQQRPTTPNGSIITELFDHTCTYIAKLKMSNQIIQVCISLTDSLELPSL